MASTSRIKRFFKKIGTRNLVILTAVLLIGATVYLNYLWFYPADTDVDYGGGSPTDGTTDVGGNTNEEASDYFTAAATAREEARDEALEVLQSVVDAGSEGSEEREAALASISKIAATMEHEANIESLLLAKGFAKCVAVIGEGTASIIVSAEGELGPAQNAQICTVVYEQTGILPEHVTIIAK